jgi:hypothetical protein
MPALASCYSIVFENSSDTPHAQFGPSTGVVVGHFDEVRHIHIRMWGLLKGDDFDLEQFLQEEIKTMGGSSIANLRIEAKHTVEDEMVTAQSFTSYFQTSVEIEGDVMK